MSKTKRWECDECEEYNPCILMYKGNEFGFYPTICPMEIKAAKWVQITSNKGE